jgi:hypothetical protein
VAHFEEAVEDEDEFQEIGGKSLANNSISLLRLLLLNIFSGIDLFQIAKLLC